ncbi:hypothetical protein BSKO_09173 [Bryopsis sp. KO-2023]|nr:hypothetical protein BSKO_09173 [Bryopsis sp. KO-2023]
MIPSANVLSRHPFPCSRVLGRFPARVQCGADFDASTVKSSKRRGRKGKKGGGAKKAKEEEKFQGLDPADRWRSPQDVEYAMEELPHPIVGGVIQGAMDRYFDQNPPMSALMDDLFQKKYSESRVAFDYLEFRTYEIEGMGMDHIAGFWEDFGYTKVEDHDISEFDVTYRWLAPPSGKALPRIVICSIKLEVLSEQSQQMIKKRLGTWPEMAKKHVSGAIAARATPWDAPTLDEFDRLYTESEFSAWVLISGYGISCAALSVNEMSNPVYRFGKPPTPVTLEGILEGVAENPTFLLNPGDEAEVLHTNDAGTIAQFATMANVLEYIFADGQRMVVVGSYLSCVERSILPECKDEKGAGSKRSHLYDGIDPGLMQKMLYSTAMALPMTAEQLNVQKEIHNRAQMDGYNLRGEGDPEEEAIIDRYLEIIMAEKQQQHNAN